MSPKGLKDLFDNGTGHIRANYANFGHIPYGQTIVGSLVFDKEGDDLGYGCEEFQEPVAQYSEHYQKMFVAKRGVCSFVQKVRNMELGGFSMGIVVDDTDADIEQIIMSDDGTGDGINIPSVIIEQRDWDTIYGYISQLPEEERGSIVFSASFSMTHPDNRVEFDIWYTSSDDRALDFISSMKEYAGELGSRMLTTPRFVYWRCTDCDSEMINKHCYVNGKYCAVDATNDKHTGQAIILEDLREKCIAKRSQFKYWLYMWYVHAMCGSNIDEACSKNGHKYASLAYSQTQKCVQKSWEKFDKISDQEYQQSNTLIDEDISLWRQYGTGKYPMVVINGVTFRGAIESTNVLEGICAGYERMPGYCADTLKKIYKNSGPYENMPDGIQPETLALIVVALIFLNVIIVYCYRRYTKREMKKEMNVQIETAVSQYMRIDPSTVQ